MHISYVSFFNEGFNQLISTRVKITNSVNSTMIGLLQSWLLRVPKESLKRKVTSSTDHISYERCLYIIVRVVNLNNVADEDILQVVNP